MKVLVAEDSDITRRVLETHLQAWGYEVQSVSHGSEALLALNQPDGPTLAILDWMMPGLDGLQVCHEVRKVGREPYVFIILLTGKVSRQDLVRGLEAGADDYIKKPFDAQELQVRMRTGKRIVCLQAELIAARESLRRDAEHDALTGLFNRRAMQRVMRRDCARAQREGSPLAALMVDIDHFKKINDTHGHAAGDEVLREMGSRLTQLLRPYDAVARLGGEEFLLVLPACDATGAAVVAERLRAAVARQPMFAGAQAIAVTCSVGVALYEPPPAGRQEAQAAQPEALIHRADLALYAAKRGGRNRVAFAPQEPTPTLT